MTTKLVEKMRMMLSNRNEWHTGLGCTLLADAPYFCFSLFCCPCASYMLRKRALHNNMSRYVCCAGLAPSCSGRCGEQHCPECCLVTEIIFCFGHSVSSTRYLLQDEFNIRTTRCDSCLIGCMHCMEGFGGILGFLGLITGQNCIECCSFLCTCISNCVYCTVCVCVCMQAQHKIEMDKRDGKFEPQQVRRAPPVQEMSRIDKPYPPTIG